MGAFNNVQKLELEIYNSSEQDKAIDELVSTLFFWHGLNA
jgi:hypothetical protein